MPRSVRQAVVVDLVENFFEINVNYDTVALGENLVPRP
jgi:hypothetical protein